VRGYLAVTPKVLGDFLAHGTGRFASAYITTRFFFQEYPEVDEEEREFELSWLAAQDSRGQQGSDASLGFVLAVDLLGAQTGSEMGNEIELLSDISWPQVESLLVAETAEAELTWYASQEIAEHIRQWMT
jgi:hypothetical protein